MPLVAWFGTGMTPDLDLSQASPKGEVVPTVFAAAPTAASEALPSAGTSNSHMSPLGVGWRQVLGALRWQGLGAAVHLDHRGLSSVDISLVQVNSSAGLTR